MPQIYQVKNSPERSAALVSLLNKGSVKESIS
jgi:hypothetical protein